MGGAIEEFFQYANIMSKIIYQNLAWDEIIWSHSYKIVRRMQKRIFKASRSGQANRMYFLQKILLRSPHAKLIAVQRVTTLNKGKKTTGIDKIKITTSSEKLKLAQTLQLNGKSDPVLRVWIQKINKTEKRPLGIPTIRDRAKQTLCLLALEPQWEAKFEANSYGFRPGRSAHDAIEAIYLNLHHNVDKLVFDADIRKCFDRIDHKALLNKLETFPLMHSQVSAWLKTGIMDEYAKTNKISKSDMGTPQGGIISPLLANVALHGLENYLLHFVSQRKMPKPHINAARGTKAKRASLGIVRYADDFVIIHRNKEIMNMVVEEAKIWLQNIGLEISEEKSKLKLASQSFRFLGFAITYVRNRVSGKYRIKIVPSKNNIQTITRKVKHILEQNKASNSYKLIGTVRPIIIGWGNYFQFCECKETFSKVDNVIWNMLRAWVFRRAIRKGRMAVKEKYFPSNKEYIYQGRTYKANWVLNGTKVTSNKKNKNKGVVSEIYLPKLSWIKSRKFVKVKDSFSIYDENEIYWAIRTPKYSFLSTRVANLLRHQNGKCKICHEAFTPTDIMEVDHIQPISKGGHDIYNNLQLLHRHCHVRKTKQDLSTA